jgi:hypothetical protein
MSEAELLECAVSEYKSVIELSRLEEKLERGALLANLSNSHDWTDNGARAIISLANQYGVFMLRNALALAIAINKEDGDLGF